MPSRARNGAWCITVASDLALVAWKWTWKSCRSTSNWVRTETTRRDFEMMND